MLNSFKDVSYYCSSHFLQLKPTSILDDINGVSPPPRSTECSVGSASTPVPFTVPTATGLLFLKEELQALESSPLCRTPAHSPNSLPPLPLLFLPFVAASLAPTHTHMHTLMHAPRHAHARHLPPSFPGELSDCCWALALHTPVRPSS